MNSGDDSHRKDLNTIRDALHETLRHLRRILRTFPPSDFESLSLKETLAMAARQSADRTGECVDFCHHQLPEQISFRLRALLYRFTLEGLEREDGSCPSGVLASCDGNMIEIEILGGPRVTAHCAKFTELRDRIEAAGGILEIKSRPDGAVSLVAKISIASEEFAYG